MSFKKCFNFYPKNFKFCNIEKNNKILELGTEQIGMNRVIFLMINIYEELHVHKLSVMSTLKWTNCSEREECNKISKIPNYTFVVQSLG